MHLSFIVSSLSIFRTAAVIFYIGFSGIFSHIFVSSGNKQADSSAEFGLRLTAYSGGR